MWAAIAGAHAWLVSVEARMSVALVAEAAVEVSVCMPTIAEQFLYLGPVRLQRGKHECRALANLWQSVALV